MKNPHPSPIPRVLESLYKKQDKNTSYITLVFIQSMHLVWGTVWGGGGLYEAEFNFIVGW